MGHPDIPIEPLHETLRKMTEARERPTAERDMGGQPVAPRSNLQEFLDDERGKMSIGTEPEPLPHADPGYKVGCSGAAPKTTVYLIAFNDGSYKKVRAVSWKHSQWIHFTLPDGSTVRVNPANVNYLHEGIED